MSQSQKAVLYRILKDAGVKFDRHYREYSTDELRQAVEMLDPNLLPQPGQPVEDEKPESPARPATLPPDQDPTASQYVAPQEARRRAPVQAPPDQIPGIRLNTTDEDEPIRTDENGLIWYQDEILKPGYAKPRARRVLQYTDPGSETRTVQNGQYLESFEVAGNHARPSEIKVTLPSYQVGIYRDPRFPFKIHVYNDMRGFDLFEVQNYYGGSDLVPVEIKRIYVENVLCYDIRTTIRAIQAEARELQLANMRGLGA